MLSRSSPAGSGAWARASSIPLHRPSGCSCSTQKRTDLWTTASCSQRKKSSAVFVSKPHSQQRQSMSRTDSIRVRLVVMVATILTAMLLVVTMGHSQEKAQQQPQFLVYADT